MSLTNIYFYQWDFSWLIKFPLILGVSALSGFVISRQFIYSPTVKRNAQDRAVPVDRSGGGI